MSPVVSAFVLHGNKTLPAPTTHFQRNNLRLNSAACPQPQLVFKVKNHPNNSYRTSTSSSPKQLSFIINLSTASHLPPASLFSIGPSMAPAVGGPGSACPSCSSFQQKMTQATISFLGGVKKRTAAAEISQKLASFGGGLG